MKKHGVTLGKKSFEAVCSHFPKDFSSSLFLVDALGDVVYAKDDLRIPANILAGSILEAVRWGECNVLDLEGESGAIVAPIMVNSDVLGGLVWFSRTLFCVSEQFSSAFILDVSKRIIDALHEENLTNKYLLEANRNAMQEERISAEVLHEKKGLSLKPLREVYIFREDALLSAIKRGQRNQARKYLNEILIYIYGQCGERIDFIKAHLIEISVMMIRGSMELGASEIRVFENSYRMLLDLSTVKDEESMSVLATQLLENVMDNIESVNSSVPERKFKTAFAHLKENFTDPEFTRHKLAAYSRLGEKQLTLLFNKFTGKGFSENLSEMRIACACQMILSCDDTATEIAYKSGFSDQSYFSKIFKKHTGLTPIAFRRNFKKKCQGGSKLPKNA